MPWRTQKVSHLTGIETAFCGRSRGQLQQLLYKEGIFFRAYERSAMRFVQHVASFKVLRCIFSLVTRVLPI